ncbi:hypothetical protein NDU88_006774 [Pleurodeles waltl]|uniref:Uncharacterized protein n=1 Tax=Pleurodeles waltl TaxID=8319 RepID=A0AAV7U0E9_PLEWA|nr:hypothetical protein NDU88_006774 [Pleurodeles waltl]
MGPVFRCRLRQSLICLSGRVHKGEGGAGVRKARVKWVQQGSRLRPPLRPHPTRCRSTHLSGVLRGPQGGGWPQAGTPVGERVLKFDFEGRLGCSRASAARGFVPGEGPPSGPNTLASQLIEAAAYQLATGLWRSPRSLPSPRGERTSSGQVRGPSCRSPRCVLATGGGEVARVGGGAPPSHPQGSLRGRRRRVPRVRPPALEAAAFRPALSSASPGRARESARPLVGSTARPAAIRCTPRRQAGGGGRTQGCRMYLRGPLSVVCRRGRCVSRDGSPRTRGRGLLSRRRPRLCPPLSLVLLGEASVPHWVLRLAHAADPSRLG